MNFIEFTKRYTGEISCIQYLIPLFARIVFSVAGGRYLIVNNPQITYDPEISMLACIC
jgi:hypothetical protein